MEKWIRVFKEKSLNNLLVSEMKLLGWVRGFWSRSREGKKCESGSGGSMKMRILGGGYVKEVSQMNVKMEVRERKTW